MTTFDVGDMHPNTPHLLADLVELLTLIGYTGRDSFHSSDLSSLLNLSNTSADEVDHEISISSKTPDAVLNDRIEEQLENVWTQLSHRSASLKDIYPFKIEGDEIFLLPKLTSKHRVYVFSLCCSRLRSFIKLKGAAQRWAKGFAIICKYAMKSLLPNHGVVRIFDANSDDRKEYYTTDLRKALRIMGRDLGVKRIDEDEIDKGSSSGDAGFDLVATVSFEDSLNCNFAILGQCGAQEEGWPKKTLEAHSINLSPYFHTTFSYPSVMFTPVFYRDSTGQWVTSRPTSGVVLLDRMRILFLIDKLNCWDEIVTLPWFINFENDFKGVIPAY